MRKGFLLTMIILFCLVFARFARGEVVLISPSYQSSEDLQLAVLNYDALLSITAGDSVVVDLGRERINAITTEIKRRSDGITWVGKSQSICSFDTFILTISEGVAFGTFFIGNERIKIFPANASGIVVVVKDSVNFENSKEEVRETVIPSSSSSFDMSELSNLEPDSSRTIVDLMVYYTQGVESHFGGASNVRAGIQHLVDTVNQAFANSLVNLEIRLVHIEKTNYPDEGTRPGPLGLPDVCGNVLEDIRAKSGWFSNMPSIRDQYGADLVTVLVRPTGYACIGAYSLTNINNPNQSESAAFSVASVNYTDFGDLIIAKALGYNFGCGDDNNPGIFNFSRAHSVPGVFATVMSDKSPLIPYYSNPNVSYDGHPTGVPDYADNARTINLTKDFVASYRQSGVEPPPPPPPTGGEGVVVNISTRGYVGTGDNVMIAGFCVENGSVKTVIRALGPSLSSRGVAGVISDPMLELKDSRGNTLLTNDNWNDPNLSNFRLQPSDPRESAVIFNANPGCYTVIVRGAHGETGIGLVEVYKVTD